MFENPGKKIKILAKVLFWVTSVVGIFFAFIFGWTEEYSYYYGTSYEFNAEIFFSLFIGVPVSSWVSSLLLYGFGEIVDKVCDIERNQHYGYGEAPVDTDELPEL